jgi:hypothetical protein
MSQGPPTGVQVSLSFFPLAFLLLLCTPRVEIDGQAYPRSWGTHFFPLHPGKHLIRIYFPYIWMSECGLNSAEIQVAPGTIARVSYFMWPWVFAPGSLSVAY